MATLHVWIPSNRKYKSGKPKGMDGLNEIINHNRTNRHVGAAEERKNVTWCVGFIRQAMREQRWPPMNSKDSSVPVTVSIVFVEANNRRDIPNIIGGGLKYTLDALSRPRGKKDGASAIYDDSREWLREIKTKVETDPDNPGVDITVREVI